MVSAGSTHGQPDQPQVSFSFPGFFFLLMQLELAADAGAAEERYCSLTGSHLLSFSDLFGGNVEHSRDYTTSHLLYICIDTHTHSLYVN